MKNSNLKREDLEKKIATYSTMAGAILLSTSPLQSAVHKTVVNQNGLSVYNFDVNNDGTTDFRLSVNSTMSGMRYLNQWKGRGVRGATLGYSKVMDYGSMIGPSRTFTNGNLFRGTKGSWAGVTDKYLGIRVDVIATGEEYHYVWVKLSVHADATFDLKEYAWEDIEDQAIAAGSDVSLPVELSAFSAASKGQTVVLEWTTESESDNMGYILERRLKDGTNWTTVADYKSHSALAGQGTTSNQTKYTFTDKNIVTGNSYVYRLSDVNIQGEVNVCASTSVQLTALPQQTTLLNSYPNPFNPETTINYQLSENTNVTISVFDILGQCVKTLYSGAQSAGNYQLQWNGTFENGLTATSGTYLICMQTEKETLTQKVMLMK